MSATDLITWLRAQLDDDEGVARKAAAFPYEEPTDAPWERERVITDSLGGNSRAAATHRIVAIFANPARVLAEVDAKRRILDALEPEASGESLDARFHAHLIRLLALPYAGRDGYREEWRPVRR